MTSREHARRLMLILLSSEGRPGADGQETVSAEREDERTAREDDDAEGDPRRFAVVDALTWT